MVPKTVASFPVSHEQGPGTEADNSGPHLLCELIPRSPSWEIGNETIVV